MYNKKLSLYVGIESLDEIGNEINWPEDSLIMVKELISIAQSVEVTHKDTIASNKKGEMTLTFPTQPNKHQRRIYWKYQCLLQNRTRINLANLLVQGGYARYIRKSEKENFYATVCIDMESLGDDTFYSAKGSLDSSFPTFDFPDWTSGRILQNAIRIVDLEKKEVKYNTDWNEVWNDNIIREDRELAVLQQV